MDKMNVLSLFDGCSCGQQALDRLGIKVDNYFASEIDKYAIQVTMANYPNTIQLGSVVNVDVKTICLSEVYDYICHKIADINILQAGNTPDRILFQQLLRHVADAMYAIEWVDSGDKSPGEEDEAIHRCMKFLQVPDVQVKAFLYDQLKEVIQPFLNVRGV